jgi:glycosyl transferase family 2
MEYGGLSVGDSDPDVVPSRAESRRSEAGSAPDVSCELVTAARMHRAFAAPRISVVLPVRDGAAFLEQALESVLSQTLRELELIVIDDGSTDRTPEILAGAAARDRRVRVLPCGSGGVVPALNEGCAAASAPFIARLDADDVALPERLEQQVAVLDAHPEVGLVGGAYFAIDPAGVRRATFRPPTHDAALRARLAKYNVFAHPAVAFRRDAFEQAGGYRLAEAEDYDLWLRISEHWQLAAVPEPVLEYRYHHGQVSLARAHDQALATLAAQAAAELRRAGRADPLDGITRATPKLLADLGFSPAEIARAVAENDVRWATTLGELGDRAGATALLDAAAGPGSPFTARRARVRYALGRAAHASRGGRQAQAAGLLVRALATDPAAAASELSALLARHHPRRR